MYAHVGGCVCGCGCVCIVSRALEIFVFLAVFTTHILTLSRTRGSVKTLNLNLFPWLLGITCLVSPWLCQFSLDFDMVALKKNGSQIMWSLGYLEVVVKTQIVRVSEISAAKQTNKQLKVKQRQGFSVEHSFTLLSLHSS